MKSNIQRSIVISIVVLALMLINYSRMVGSDCVRAIHITTFMVAGAAAYVLVVNIIALIKGKS